MPTAIAVISGPALVFDLANAVYSKVVGPGRPLTGLPLLTAMPELRGQGVDDLLRGVMRTGKPHVGREAHFKMDRLGEGLTEDTYWDFIYAPLKSGDGSIDRVIVVCTDVTDQVLARLEREKSIAELSRALHFSGVFVGILGTTCETR